MACRRKRDETESDVLVTCKCCKITNKLSLTLVYVAGNLLAAGTSC